MHEQVHQGAGEEQQIGQNAQQMRTVFRQQEKSGNHHEADQDDSGTEYPLA
ncbi:hypothetical protein V475_20610 [Sphingobium baderi LL03]|nr:hypothetical protein V475_20610 [Sphingobium baderi LL03]